MSSPSFSVGDLVWAKMKGYPPWPAKITTPPLNLKSLAKKKKGHQCCFFFGSENYSWIPNEQISKHSESMIPKTMKRQSAQFREAVNMIIEQSLAIEVEEVIISDDSDEEVLPSTSGIGSKLQILKEKMKTQKKHESKARKRSRKRKSSPETSRENKVDKSVTTPKKKKRVQKSDKEKKSKIISTYNDDYVDENSQSSSRSDEIAFLSSDEESPEEDLSFIPGYYPDSIPKCIERPTYVERPSTPEFNMNEISDIIKSRNVIPVAQRFGFLGLGYMGKIIAKHFLHTGHHLTVWNRSPEKCDEFVAAGARRGQTPADVVAASDIIFCCLSDTEAVRSIVFDNCGVLNGMDRAEKGFCVLNTITPFASIEIGDAISCRGGTYLEAFLHGTRTMAENGTMLIIAGGSHDLFHDCCSCFRAIAKDVYYVNYEIGEAAIVNIFTNLLNACIVNALAGAMLFVNKNEGSLSDFTSLLQHSRVASNALIRNANAIRNKDFSTNMSIKFMQQSLTSALELTNTAFTPTYISSVVNEQYKKAASLRYLEHDATAIYQAM